MFYFTPQYSFCSSLFKDFVTRFLMKIFKTSIFIFIVCAEAYNPDEEEDDAESRVCNLMNILILNKTPVLDKENNNRKAVDR